MSEDYSGIAPKRSRQWQKNIKMEIIECNFITKHFVFYKDMTFNKVLKEKIFYKQCWAYSDQQYVHFTVILKNCVNHWGISSSLYSNSDAFGDWIDQNAQQKCPVSIYGNVILSTYSDNHELPCTAVTADWMSIILH